MGVSEIQIFDTSTVETGTLSFTVERDDTSMACTVSYETFDDTAIQGVDYAGDTNTVVMDVGVGSVTLDFGTFNDHESEPTERMLVELTGVEPAESCVIVRSVGYGMIDDDDYTTPFPPSDGLAESSGQHVDLSWNGTGTNASSYEISRSRWNGTAWVDDGFAETVTSTSASILFVPDGRYIFYVVSKSGPFVSDPLAIPIVHSAAVDPPLAPTSLEATVVDLGVQLAWVDESFDEFGYDIMRARYVAGVWDEWTFLASADRGTTGYFDDTVGGGLYAYVVRSHNAIGASVWVVDTVEYPTGALVAPAAPTDLGSTLEVADVTLGWTDNADNESWYEVMRAHYDASTGSWDGWTTFVQPADAVTFTDEAVPDGPYAYLVRAVNPIGASDWAIVQVGVTAGAPPSAPVDFVASQIGDLVTQMTFSDTSATEWGFEVYRARFDETEWTDWTYSVLLPNSAGFGNDLPVPGLYAYLIRAYNGDGASDWVLTTVAVVPV